MTPFELEVIAKPFQPFHYFGRLIRVLDADTIELELDQGLRGFQKDLFRIVGVDAWEVTGAEKPQGLVAQVELEKLLTGELLEVRTFKLPSSAYARRSLARWLAHVRVHSTQVDVREWIVANGHGVPA